MIKLVFSYKFVAKNQWQSVRATLPGNIAAKAAQCIVALISVIPVTGGTGDVMTGSSSFPRPE